MTNYLDKFKLQDKTAYVVGGLGLIGKEVSKAFSSAGAKTIILDTNDIKGKSIIEEFSNKNLDVFYRDFNCAKSETLEDELPMIVKEYGLPDIFINCSYPRTADWASSNFKDVNLESFKLNIEMQLISYAWLSRLIAELMFKNKISGSIIHLSSIYGKVAQDLSVYKNTTIKENMAYPIIKGGLISLTRQMASFYGKNNIRTNNICPGGLIGHVAGSDKGQDDIFVKQYTEKVPLKRMGKNSEVASVALFLASNASTYINGSTITVDGGWTIV